METKVENVCLKMKGKIKQREDGSLSNLKQEIHVVERQKEQSGFHPLIQ